MEWRPYTNERTKKSGWISEGGKVTYTDPHKAEAEKRERLTTANTAVATTINDPSKLTDGHIEALRTHLDTLPRDRLRELTKQVAAKSGGLKMHLAERLIAHVSGQPQPQFDYGKKPKSESLFAAVQRFGGIDPNSHAFKTVYSNMKNAMEDGIALGVFRKNGRGLDQLAQELHAAGHIQLPEGVHPQEYLLEQLKAGVKSLHADTRKELESAEEEYYRKLEEMERWADESAGNRAQVKRAIDRGSKAGSAEGASYSFGNAANDSKRNKPDPDRWNKVADISD